MKFSNNFVSAINKLLGFELIKTDETIDEATARIEGMQPLSEQLQNNIQALQTAVQNHGELDNKVAGIEQKITSLQEDLTTKIKSEMDVIAANVNAKLDEIQNLVKPSATPHTTGITIPETTVKDEDIVLEKPLFG